MRSLDTLLVFASGESAAMSDQAIVKFAHFLGLQTQQIFLGGVEAPQDLRKDTAGVRVLAIGRKTLRLVFRQDWFVQFLDQIPFIFAYDFEPADSEWPELEWLSGGSFALVSTLGEGRKQFIVHEKVTHTNFSVSGKSYRLDSNSVSVFSRGREDSAVESYISVDEHPHFVSVRRGRSCVFLLAGPSLVDIDTVLTPADDSLRPWYAQLIALSIALRSAFGAACWTSPVTAANFIVDDPYLKKRYGFINYEQLTVELQEARGALTIAFIPYNYRRSEPRTVELLRRYSEHFSIAVHGCDHTAAEYASLNPSWLATTTGCALSRMEEHSRRTGMPFDNVMVFPQGKFSTKAIEALKSCGFTAASNSGAWPVDYAENPLTIRDLLQVAVTRYANFPIFVRRYPGDTFDYAFDALFQKPVLAVEHHSYFRDGYGTLGNLVRDISALIPRVRWMPLGDCLASSCVIRQTATDQFVLRHFSDHLRVSSPSATAVVLHLEKPEIDCTVTAVEMGEGHIPFEIRAGFLRYSINLAPGQKIEVRVVRPPRVRVKRRITLKHLIAVAARRLLSDVRDNYLSRHKRALLIAERIRNSLQGW